MKAIVAADRNWGIGYQNRLLVSIPSDMKFFRQTTTGHVVVMGRKTLESFPNGLPLKNRTNIVLTANKDYAVKDAIIVHSEKELLEELKDCELFNSVVRLICLCDVTNPLFGTNGAARVFARNADNVYVGRLQRLPDDFSAQGSYPRC